MHKVKRLKFFSVLLCLQILTWYRRHICMTKNYKQLMHATVIFIAVTQQVGVAAAPSDGTPVIATQGFRGLSRSLQANDGIVVP